MSADQIKRASDSIRSLMNSGSIGELSTALLDAAPALAAWLEATTDGGMDVDNYHEAVDVAREILGEES